MNSESQHLAPVFKILLRSLPILLYEETLYGRQVKEYNLEEICSQQFCFSHKEHTVAQNCN